MTRSNDPNLFISLVILIDGAVCHGNTQLGGRNMRKRTYAYIVTRKRCGACALKAQCTSGAFRFLAIHMDEPARQRARELANTPEFAHAQRQRKKVEALFAELKNQIGLRRLRLRRLSVMSDTHLCGRSGCMSNCAQFCWSRLSETINVKRPVWLLPQTTCGFDRAA